MSTDGQTPIANASESPQTPSRVIPVTRREHIRTRFDPRELVEVKGITFVVQDIGEERLVLRPLDVRSWK